MGSFPTAYLAGRGFRKMDIRLHGSGNVGATNAFRVLGKKIGTLVFVIDLLKGFLPVFFLSRFVSWGPLDSREVGLWIGVGAILGHVFTPFLGFKGGKGIATGAGVLWGVFPALFLLVLTVWITVFLLSRIVSLSSLVAVISLVAFGILFQLRFSITLFFLGICLFTFWTHRSNISRLIQGKENTIN